MFMLRHDDLNRISQAGSSRPKWGDSFVIVAWRSLLITAESMAWWKSSRNGRRTKEDSWANR